MKSPLGIVACLGLFSLAACTDGGLTSDRELRDPKTTTARQALDASTSRDAAITEHSATLLADGTVLLAGGRDLSTPGADAEGTPSRKAWLYVSSEVGLTPVPDLVTARAGHTAIRLWDGAVLIAGGFDATGNALKSTELFVPDDAAFTSGASMLSAHGDATATLLEDGRVLVVGGYEDAKHEHPSTGIELYDPPTQTFRTVQNPRHRAGSNVAVTLADGTVAIDWADAADPTAELFDPSSSRLNLPEPPLFGGVASEGIVAAARLPSGALALLDGAGFHTTDPSGQCASGSGACNGQCTSFATADDCGACGNACPDDATCINQTCMCNSGTLCDGLCRDVMSDTQNCGTCRNACGAGQRCVSGQCQDGCGTLTDCSGDCVDTTWDTANCGACGHACGGSAWYCYASECLCNGNVCGSTCFPYDDHDHCGTCTRACGSDETCLNGTCQPSTCPLGMLCSGKCVDLTTDPDHCGNCETACGSSEICGGRVCRPCGTGLLRCGDACVDLFYDELNCGGCGTVCNGTCSNGVCQTCPAGQALCGGYCTPVNTRKSCGACARECATGYDCVNGDCVLTPGGAVPTLAAGSVWMTESSSATSYSEAALEGVAGAASSPNALPVIETYGGNGHTTTALPDGSLLVVGGNDTPRAVRIYPSWMNRYQQSLDLGALAYPESSLTTLLPDGRLLILIGTVPPQPAMTNVYLYDGQQLGVPAGSLPFAAPVGAAVQASGKVLLLAYGGTAALLDPDTVTATGLELDASLASQAQGTSIALPGGGLLVAGSDGFDVLSAPSGKTLHVHARSVDIGCDTPSVTRLANGRVLVVGQDRLYEVDPKSGDIAASADLILPRCDASAIQRHDGTVLLVGGLDGSSVTAELYDPIKGTTKRWSLENANAPPDAKVRMWFDEPLLMSSTAGMLLDWQSNILTDAQLGLMYTGENSHLTADGSWLGVADGTVIFARRSSDVPDFGGGGGEGGGAGATTGGQGGVGGHAGTAGAGGTGGPAGKPSMTSAPKPRIYTAEVPTLHMAGSVDFDAAFPDHPFPGRAPEGSSGTTRSSPTNLPIPVWFPAEGGWPSLGMLMRSGSQTTYRVPSTPFPGLGLLFLATNGDLTPLGPVTIAPSLNATACRDGGECDSGYCVDGVCCNRACDGTCEACSKATKGGGNDGECGSVAAGTPDAACRDDITTCGENGTCDGSGHCALYPDGTECGPDARCRTQSSTGRRSCVENAPVDDNGAAGSAGAPDVGSGGTGGTRSEPPTPGSMCDADEEVVSPEGKPIGFCKPYRCRNAECVKRCESTRDCASGYACDSKGECVAPVTQHAKPVGCGCRVPLPTSSTDGGLLSLLAATACFARRRKRRPFGVSPPCQ